jgi:hypothetical protein
MDWKDIAGKIAGAAPMLSAVLAATGVGAPVAAAVSAAGALISSQLGVPNTPDDVAQALITNPDAAIKLKELDVAHGEHLAELANVQAKQVLDAQVAQLETINTTMQVEDKTREFSWRDFWGYVSGVAFGFVVVVVGYLVYKGVSTNHPEQLAAIPAIVGAFSTLFGIAALVLGVQSSIETHHAGMAERIAAGTPTAP